MQKASQMGPNTKVKEKQCEGTTTQQLLADLTDDFEEAITAQICLSNQLLDANIESVESSKEEILILKTESSATKSIAPLPMELNNSTTPITEATTTTNTTTTTEVKIEENSGVDDEVAAVAAEINNQETTIVDKSSIAENDEILATPCESRETYGTSLSVEAVETQPTASTSSTVKQDVTRPAIISVEALPPIRTDSTMTASEVEDNIEERLSQLDGNSTIHPSCEETNEVVTAVMDALSATRARTPTATTQQRVDQLTLQQQQLHRTPPHTQSQHLQQQNNYTPQSTTSSINTIGSSSTHIPKDFMKDSSAGELEDQDIEEVLKALKGLDSSTAADTICDLNVLFNEVYTTLNYEEINSQHNSSACGSKAANPLKEIQADIEKKQQTMQRKIDFLLRRLRKIQTRYMCKHTSEEISGLFEYSARIASKGVKLSHEDDINDRQQLNFAEQKLYPVTSTQIASMLRKIEMVANAQQLSTAHSSTSISNIGRRKPAKKVSSVALNSSHDLSNAADNERKANTVTVVPTFDAKITEEIGHVTGLLQSEMHEIQNAIDSDATESSSGGESADEMVTYNNQLQQSLQIAKRAAWRYSRDRAAIASRWSWLLSQISDLEIKIRQHSELHQELLRTKGSSVQGIEPKASTKTATTMANSTPYNGFKATVQEQSNSGIKKENSDDETSCCRTRGVLASNFRKRKLFQTANIHTFSKKAARPSTIKCGCQWPLLPCALCTGRADPTSPRDLPDTMMLADRVALLDPGYHPVLSFPGDVSNSIHFEALCRLPDWQQRVLRCPVKNIAKSLWRAERDAMHAMGGKKNTDTAKRKYIKKKDLIRDQQKQANNGNGTGTLTISSTPLVANRSMNNMTTKTLPARINNNNNNNNINHNNYNNHHQMSDYHQQNYAQYNPSQALSSSISNSIKNNKNRKLSSSVTGAAAGVNSTFHYNHHPSNDNNYSNSELNYLHSDSWDSQVTRSRTSSPTHSGSKKNKSLDRRNRTSYDIDNIVIPYSVAAATRVELLPYKEIPTPKWRIIEDSIDMSPPASDTEHYASNLKETMPSSVECNNKNNIHNDGESDTSKLLTEAKLSEIVKTTVENNVANDTNHDVETTFQPKTSSIDAAADSNKNNKCRLTTKRTYSEKENSVDTTDAFDTIKDSNIKSPTADDLKSSCKSIAKILKTTDDIQQQKDDAAAESDMQNHIRANKLNNDADASATNNLMDGSDEDGVEDITDDAMVLRHERALIEERQRLKFPWSTRSRANRRIDSRVDWSSGANTPDPASPATNTPSLGGGDLDSIPSPAAPSTPLNPLDSISEVVEPANPMNSGAVNSAIALTNLNWQNSHNKRYERRRTTSAKNNKEQERRSTSPDSREFIPPFEPRKFPIPNEIFENMIQMDNFLSANSTTSKILTNNFKNENICKKSNHKLNNINSSLLDHRNVGMEVDESEAGLSEVDLLMQQQLTASDEEYQPYHEVSFPGKKNSLIAGDSDVDTSEADPFSDDDPNDPEWRGETEDREKIRRKT